MDTSYETTISDGLENVMNQEIRRREGLEAPSSLFSKHEVAISVLEDVLKDVQYRLAARRHQRNSLLHLHSLPIELFQRMIMHTRHITPYGDISLKQLQKLRVVCKHWAKVIDETPRLWAVINQQDPPALWELALKRSKNSRLTIAIPYPREDDDLDSFVELVAPHSVRWKSLKIHLRRDWDERGDNLSKLFSCPVPVLESCEIGSDDMTRCPTPFEGQTPNLRSVRIQELHMPWEGSALSAFSSLISLDMDTRNGITHIEQLCNIISACPQLVKLALSATEFDPNVLPTRSIAVIHLPYLKYFKLLYTESKAASLILHHIDAPQVKLVLQSEYKGMEEAYNFVDLFAQHIGSFIGHGGFAEPPQSLRVYHEIPRHRGCQIELGGFSLIYRGEMNAADETLIFKRIFSSFTNLTNTISTLEIRGEGMKRYTSSDEGIPLHVLLAVDEYFPNICHIKCVSVQLYDVVAALAPWPWERRNLEPILLFRELKDVVVTSHIDYGGKRSSPGLSVALLLRLARSRLEMSKTDSSMARFEKVTAFLPEYTPEELQELRDVVPEVDLNCLVVVDD